MNDIFVKPDIERTIREKSRYVYFFGENESSVSLEDAVRVSMEEVELRGECGPYLSLRDLEECGLERAGKVAMKREVRRFFRYFGGCAEAA